MSRSLRICYFLNDEHLKDFIECYCAQDVSKRKESERFKKFSYDEIIERDKTNLDIENSLADLENLPEPEVLAESIVKNLQKALDCFGKLNV